MTIRNPVEWGSETFRQGTHAVGSGGHAVYHREDINSLVPSICKIDTADLRDVLRKGLEDFGVKVCVGDSEDVRAGHGEYDWVLGKRCGFVGEEGERQSGEGDDDENDAKHPYKSVHSLLG